MPLETDQTRFWCVVHVDRDAAIRVGMVEEIGDAARALDRAGLGALSAKLTTARAMLPSNMNVVLPIEEIAWLQCWAPAITVQVDDSMFDLLYAVKKAQEP
jgi:hypothetical protein